MMVIIGKCSEKDGSNYLQSKPTAFAVLLKSARAKTCCVPRPETAFRNCMAYLPESLNPAPRHAEVLPSFAVGLMRRRLACSAGMVEGAQLLAWSGALPSPALAKEIREKFIQGRRNQFAEIWSKPVGVRVVPGWEAALEPPLLDRFRELLAGLPSPGVFPSMTLQEVKGGLRMSVASTFEVLAKLESLHWSTSDVNGVVVRHPIGGDLGSEGQVGDAWRVSMRKVLQARWIDQASPYDLRFSRDTDAPLALWLLQEIEKPQVPPAVVALCDRLSAADGCDWAAELRSIATAAVQASKQRPSDKVRERWIAMFVYRFGGVKGRSLWEVANEFDMTRERVRSIMGLMTQAVKERSAVMPALDKLLDAAMVVSHLSAEVTDEQLANLLGPGIGLGAALAFAQAVGADSAAASQLLKSRSQVEMAPIRSAKRLDNQRPWAEQALAFVRTECAAVGCTTPLRVAGHLAMEGGRAVERPELEALFRSLPGYCLLDSEGGWFSVPGLDDCVIATQLKKLFSVASQAVCIDDLMAVLLADAAPLGSPERSLTVPPAHVLSKLIASWTWLYADRRREYRPKQPIEPEKVLTGPELAVFAALQRHQEVATRAELAADVAGQAGLDSLALDQVLAGSPVVAKVERGMYRINGRPLPIAGIIAAQGRGWRRPEEVPEAQADPHASLTIEIRQSASATPAAQRVVFLPMAFRERVSGSFEHARGLWPAIKVRSSMQIAKLSQVAEQAGFHPKEIFELEINLQARTYELPGVVQVA